MDAVMPKVIATTRGDGGEYSTILRDGDVLETAFFGDDGSSRVIGVTVFQMRQVHHDHIERYRREVLGL